MFNNSIYCFILTRVFALLSLQFVVALNYCGSDVCNNTKQHTLCKFQSAGPAKHCIEYERTIKTAEDRKGLLNKINERRNKIAAGDVRSFPSAENMFKLEWNDELEKSAQRWADQCVEQNSTPDLKDACRDLGQIPVGQNIATVYGEAPGLSPLSLVDVWYTELLNANASVIHRYMTSSDGGFSHYDYFTQLVWALSREVGCGGVKFKERLEGNKNRTVNRLVCNFAVSGNNIGEVVYSVGPPCSRCPIDSDCDLEYTALCSVNKTKSEDDKKAKDLQTVSGGGANFEVMPCTDTTTGSDSLTEDENITFDYISHYFDFTRQTITMPPVSSTSCKEILAVDEFIEILKKKLSNDPMFKEFLLSTKSSLQNGNGDYTFTDPNVAVFVSKIYSKKVPTTTTKLPEQEYVNSTLLVDLVEAVIFRSGERTVSTPLLEDIKQPFMDVSPVKIQAELAEVKVNNDFTGHYFFPEDITAETNTETNVDTYDDTSRIPVSDVVLEIENLKRTESTKDFLEDIIEADFVTERPSERRKRERAIVNGSYVDNSEDLLKSRRHIEHENPEVFTKYSDLLKKLASDLKVLKLNERFHCSCN